MIAVRYHDSTKHHFNRFARSLGYLDWATQPSPFRRYNGAPLRALSHAPLAADVPYAALYTRDVAPKPVTEQSIGEFLRCSMGLSAWKEYGQSRWALRVNPSSGNLHPTEAWIIHDDRVCHYTPREHALEERCVLGSRTQRVRAEEDMSQPERRGLIAERSADYFLVALTSIIWREAWKYGERAFRYCQHDTGHAIGALRFAAAMLGWRMQLLPEWSDAQIAALLGLDREADFGDAEHEEPECVALVTSQPGFGIRDSGVEPEVLVDAARNGSWFGRANRLSPGQVDWPIIDEVTLATRYPGIRDPGFRGVLQRDSFLAMLRRLRPGAPPWDAIEWPPHIHLVLFVHRVQDVTPGVYAYVRDPSVRGEWTAAMRPEFLWEEVEDGLFLLLPIEAGRIANRLSCDQTIAEDGFFGLGMIARFEQPLRERGEWFYRRLFWECGLIGQVLYLEAEAAGGRATGIGCYYDDPVHDLLGLSGHQWQSLYHFSMGLPVEDTRLTSEPGYEWEK